MLFAVNALAADRLMVIDSQLWSSSKDAVAAVEAYGGWAKFVIPPHFMIADIPDGAEAGLLATSPITAIYASDVEPADFAVYGPEGRHIAAAWNNVFMGRSAQAGLENEPSPDHAPLINDADLLDKMVLPLKPPGAKYYDVSEFMMGTCIVGIILPESNGTIDPNTEDWTQAEMDAVTSEIIGGLDFYVARKEYRTLTFYTVFNYQVGTSYEPISRSSSEESLWASQCLTALGYAGYPGYAYATALRDSANCDWATIVFVVDSSTDADGMFTDGRFGYSYLGGPKITMTYDNDGWGIANMDAVLAHEMGHSFYALDEYYDAGHGCTETCGYLAYENQNSEYPGGAGGCAINVRYCIMRSQPLSVARICNYTKGHIGWPDADADSIPDILDTFPETTIVPHSPDPDTVETVTYTGTATATKLTNLNPYGKGNEITLNRIEKVEWQVDGAGWLDAIPTDGAWDEAAEDYYFVTGVLTNGPHIFEARAHHTYENVDPTPAADTLTIDRSSGVTGGPAMVAMSLDAQPNPFGPKVDICYSVPGDNGASVPALLRVYDVKGRQIATLVDQALSPGPGRISWDGTYSGGRTAPSGIYFVELVAGDTRVVGKLVLAR
jgi:hypothetical protein